MSFRATLSLGLYMIIISSLIAAVTAGKSESPIAQLPGAEKFDTKLMERIRLAKASIGSTYKPRTRHLRPDGWATYTNRLFLETSPYLLQHAHNPVNWYPWGDEAFEMARRLKRPVFLSVGYSTCHWCHVMEEESFENEEIARVLNENFIAIKVDREERPDVDAIYMSAVQALTGSGGWPMSVWLTPDRKPFYGGTYFPPDPFKNALVQLKRVYDSEQGKITESVKQLAEIIPKMLSPEKADTVPKAEVLHRAIKEYKTAFDSKEGGLSGRMKFPSSLPIRLLLRYHRRTQDAETLKMAELTLSKMAAGGMYDQVGGGFHRYSTDPHWLVPHFEKMLYDNALLAMDYLEAFQVTRNPDFERITREILRYISRDMTSSDGVFFSATDADSPAPSGKREEGWFFTWTSKEIREVLSKEEVALVETYYGVSPSGNFEGRNILHVSVPLDEVVRKLKISADDAGKLLESTRNKLYEARKKRLPPLRDEKILTAWNALMVSAFARAGLLLNDESFIKTATRAANFIHERVRNGDRLQRSFKDGKARLKAYLEDYAFLIAADLDLYEATSDIEWLKRAILLEGQVEKFYQDKMNGGFFLTASDAEKLLARDKTASDNAIPSGNSIMAMNLLRLYEFTTKKNYQKGAELTFKAFSGSLNSHPTALSEMCLAIDYYVDKPKEIFVVTPEGKKAEAQGLLSKFRERFLPNRVFGVVAEGKELQTQSEVIPLVKGKKPMGGKVTAYVCERGLCELPTGDPAKFAEQLKKTEKL